jgi:hypothetical protein
MRQRTADINDCTNPTEQERRMRAPRRPFIFVILVLSLVLLYNIRRVSFIRVLASRLISQDGESYGKAKDIELSTNFTSSKVNPSLENRTAVLVVGHLKSENIDWIHRELPQMPTAIYTVDDPKAPLRPPKNKGREAMVYLTFIIENYDSLPDTSIFIHSHADTWHNANLLGTGTTPMIERLNHDRVAREGYVNLRCEWFPGCPARQHLVNPENSTEGEGHVFQETWSELHPMDPMPDVLAQPCCAQFAASRRQIRSVPLDRWIHYRNWLLKTELDDWIAGLIFEYTWQYIFTGNSSLCVDPHVCYCDGYGICFGSKEKFRAWMDQHERTEQLAAQYYHLRDTGGEDVELESQLRVEEDSLKERLEDAMKRGEDFKNREAEIGHV